MKFLVDAQLPHALASWISSRGHFARHVRDIGLRDADDRTIWARACADDAILVTKDEDFVLLSAKGGGPPIIWVRTGNLVKRLLLARFEQAWPQICLHLEDGVHVVELR